MKLPKLRIRTWLVTALAVGLLPFQGLAAGDTLLEADFENLNGEWPSGWPQKDYLRIESEGGNHFLRITSIDPGQMYMVYKEIPIPEGTEAIHFTWKERVSDLERGEKSWHDARIMMEYIDASREKAGRPPNPRNGRNTDGWQDEELKFNVPENARTIKFMPCLFNVNAGKYDFDDIVMKAIPKLAPEEDPAHQRKLARQEKTENIRDKARANFDQRGNVFPNGDFEKDSNSDGRPDGWGGNFHTQGSNTFIRINAKPDELAMNYSKHALPSGAEAMELTFDWRVFDLKPGKKAWFDARIMMNLIDSKGKKKAVGPIYTRKSITEWQQRSRQFLVPDDVVYLEFMPSLFNVKSGTLDIDNVSLKPVDAEPLKERMEARKAERERLTVDPEEADRSKWPPMLKVKGNRLVDPQGREVWLQGVNIASMEWGMGENVLKSAQVATEEWGANVIRLPVKPVYWFSDSEKDREKYRKKVDDMITYIANRGGYLVLDLHSYRAPRPEYVDFWKSAAERYKNHPAVMFDILNEPHGVSWEVWRNGGFVKTKEKKGDEDAFLSEAEKKHNARGFESPGMQALVDAVRSTGAKNIVVAGGLDWAYDLTGILKGYALDDPSGNGIMYSTHVYPWKSNWTKKFLEVADKHPILVGEVGADAKKMSWMPADRQEDWQTWVPRMIHTIQEYRLNWTAWCFHPKASPRMLLDWEYTPTPFWGKFVKQAFAGKKFDPDPIKE